MLFEHNCEPGAMNQHNQNPRRLKRFLDGINPRPLTVDIPYDKHIDLPKVEVQTPLPDSPAYPEFAAFLQDCHDGKAAIYKATDSDRVLYNKQAVQALLSQLREGAPKTQLFSIDKKEFEKWETDNNMSPTPFGAYRIGKKVVRDHLAALFDKLESRL
jgi:hypothetical protein